METINFAQKWLGSLNFHKEKKPCLGFIIFIFRREILYFVCRHQCSALGKSKQGYTDGG